MHLPHFIVVCDRGFFRAGWIEPLLQPTRPRLLPSQPRLHVRWVEQLSFVLPRQHLVEQVTDLSGAFAPTNSSGSSLRHMQSSPADLHWKIAADKRAVENLCGAITAVLLREKPESWSLAAPADIHHSIEAGLPQVCRSRLLQLLSVDLAEASAESIIQHFTNAPGKAAAHGTPAR